MILELMKNVLRGIVDSMGECSPLMSNENRELIANLESGTALITPGETDSHTPPLTSTIASSVPDVDNCIGKTKHGLAMVPLNTYAGSASQHPRDRQSDPGSGLVETF